MERRRTEHAASITPGVAGVIATLPLRCCVGEVSDPPAQSRTPPGTTIRAAWSAPAISPRSVSSSPDSSRLARVLWGLGRHDRPPDWLRADCSPRASLRDEWLELSSSDPSRVPFTRFTIIVACCFPCDVRTPVLDRGSAGDDSRGDRARGEASCARCRRGQRVPLLLQWRGRALGKGVMSSVESRVRNLLDSSSCRC
jgi:hypothetical protein